MISNPFTMVVAIVAIVMIAQVIKARYRQQGASHGRTPLDAENERLRNELKALKERVAVLERLATDETSALEREFEKLKGRD